MSDDVRQMIIIGSGPAGLTAAIYASRANLEPLMFEGYNAGGQLMITTDVENYPGFAEGVMGPDLMIETRKQAVRFGAEIVTSDVEKVDFSERPYKVWVEGKEYRGHTVVVATGANPRLLGIPGEMELMGHGVSTCATCDGAFFKDQVIGIVGGGDSAMEEATFLTRFGSKVVIMHRREEFRASKIMAQRAIDNPKIEVLWNTVVTEAVGQNGRLHHVNLENTKNGEKSELELGALFVAIGHTPTTQLFEGMLDMDETGYLVTEGKSAKTNIPGVFACGDCQDHTYRQAITAAGSGCMAAIDAERWLEDQHG
jgi:thioredoxin reductase (NADPH)